MSSFINFFLCFLYDYNIKYNYYKMPRTQRKIYKYNLYLKKNSKETKLENGIENLYSILGLNRRCNNEEINNAYNRYIQKFGRLLVLLNTSNENLSYVFDTILASMEKSHKILNNLEYKKEHDCKLEEIFKNNDYIKIEAPKDKYYADPQLFKFGSKTYIFFEEYDYIKGVISCISVDDDMNISKPIKVLEQPYHLSFPYIFSDGQKIFMVPETSKNGTIELYISDRFPLKWTKYHTILTGVWASDTVIFELNGIWWLFTTIRDSHNFTIMYSFDLLSKQWLHHNFNNTDKLHGRMAGAVFRHNGKLIRPVQCCIPKYGYCVIFYEITTLSRTNYVEKEVGRFFPNWEDGIIGTHTFSVSENLIVFDGKFKL